MHNHMESKEFTSPGIKEKSRAIEINCPEQLASLKKGERISTEGLVKSMTRSNTKPSLPDEFVIKNNGEGIIETLKESIEGSVARSIYEISGNYIRNFNVIVYNATKPLAKDYKIMLNSFKKRNT